ncbi:enoyl-CoA hydratase/isomerase family protein [Comamonas sp. Y33R10-2]|uniref:enoyl-CoA hydratase/isomerase family protein n=1 Tax=Comamonas sp. Y33R10-2 TaxID=2853257 RepID=UPI001C5CB0FE|nr:enoyl-CoA hydratase/isomerase family protein [Comamonas sp. Y33R10-2]QXZ08788.1 enoyl-CoA hydratase/isomerase family protein [Comamonas sp. Y33R10-2]
MSPELLIQGARASITLRRPEVANKLMPEDLITLRRQLDEVNANPQVLVLTLQGVGKHFCSGYDIGEIVNSQNEGSSFGEMVATIESCRAVTIAAIQGGVFGGATDMALACDFRVGGSYSQMFMPAARLGLHFYLSGLERYVTRLGVDTAKRLFLTCEKLNAQAMKDCGFLTDLVDGCDIEERVTQLQTTLAGMAPLALLGMKKHLNAIARGVHDKASIDAAVQATIESADLNEGGAAWREKRQPQFKGC